LFAGGLFVAVALTLWIMSKLIEQDAKRIEMKESILCEVRERHGAVMGAIEQRYSIIDSKVDNLTEVDGALGNRLTRIETILNSKRR